jgi:hypothetical protein
MKLPTFAALLVFMRVGGTISEHVQQHPDDCEFEQTSVPKAIWEHHCGDSSGLARRGAADRPGERIRAEVLGQI